MFFILSYIEFSIIAEQLLFLIYFLPAMKLKYRNCGYLLHNALYFKISCAVPFGSDSIIHAIICLWFNKCDSVQCVHSFSEVFSCFSGEQFKCD